MSERQLPWGAHAPDGSTWFWWTVRDAEGHIVCECHGDALGQEVAVAIVWAVNRQGDPECGHCGEMPATCFGDYEGRNVPDFACDECCGHGNEDGHCHRLEEKR